MSKTTSLIRLLNNDLFMDLFQKRRSHTEGHFFWVLRQRKRHIVSSPSLMAACKANTLILILQLLPWCQKDIWLSLAWCMWATWRSFARCYKPCWKTFVERQGWGWEHGVELTSVTSQQHKGRQAAGGLPIHRFWGFWRLYIDQWGLSWLCSSCRETQDCSPEQPPFNKGIRRFCNSSLRAALAQQQRLGRAAQMCMDRWMSLTRAKYWNRLYRQWHPMEESCWCDSRHPVLRKLCSSYPKRS